MSETAGAYDRANNPFWVCNDQQRSLVIMRTSNPNYKPRMSDAEKGSQLAGYQVVLDSDVVEAHEMIARIRSKYGLHGLRCPKDHDNP